MAGWQRWYMITAVIGGLTGLGCDSRRTSAPSPTGRPKIAVLASVYPMAEMVNRIGGGYVEVQWLAEGGQRPEEVEAAGGDLKQRANKAEMMITSGPWDGWAVAELSEEAREARLVEPGRTAAARGADARSYLWLDPALVREVVEAARARLSAIDANREADYRANARGYQAEVDAVDGEFREGLAGVKGKTVLAVRPVWGAMCARYGLELRTPVVAEEGKSAVIDERLTQADFREIALVAKAAGATAIFVDVSTPVAVRQQIEEKTGLRAVTLDALGSSAADGRNTWAKVMRYDLAQLKKGLE
jgi:zinc transport system substrate-binding protein